ncbi:hypothetical protein OS121_20945 [Mycolicibacterium mucogenicum]|nr:hypothetical protein [Mycolicibacterium mucogenicum]MCX8557520.1 hypothetical protein [Mycolicibacterium mucogenicum]
MTSTAAVLRGSPRTSRRHTGGLTSEGTLMPGGLRGRGAMISL